MKTIHLIFALLGLFCLTLPAFPQSQATGNITGRVQDSSGALIPGVEVAVSSPAMIGGVRTAVTDETGTYRFTLLVPGTYRVSFALAGFKTLNIDGVDVTPNATRTITGTMEVATVAEEVTVTSQAPAIDVQAATVGVNWDGNKLDNLPSARSLNSLVTQFPGISFTGTYDVGGSQFGTTSGVAARTYGRSGNNVIAVDGLVWCQGYADYGSFEEINVSTASKGADQANSGVTLNMVIKSGSNQFHGNFTGQYERGSFQSTNIDDSLTKRGLSAGTNKFTYLRNLYGDIGGPIMRDRLWFYFSYMSGYQGEFRPGYISTKDNAPAVFYTKLDNPTGKLTYQITPKQKFDASWQINRKWQPYRGASKYQPLEATQNQDSWATYGPNGKWTYIISPKATATAGINRGGYWWPDIPWSGAATNSVVSLPGIPTADDLNTVRRTDLTTRALVGPQLKIYRRPIRWTWNGDVSFFSALAGKNSELKFGYTGWWTKNYTTNFGYPNQQLYRYRSSASEDFTGETTTAKLLGLFQHPDSVQVFDYPNSTANTFGYKSFYIDEKLNWNKKLTLKAGVRYDRFDSWLPAQGRKGEGPKGYIPADFATPFLYPAQPSSLFPVISKFVPRLSFAYDITGTGRLAIKGSFGRYTSYSSGIGNPVDGAADVNPNATTTCTYNGWKGDIPFTPAPGNYTSVSGCNTSFSTDVSKWPKKLAGELDASYLDEYTAGLDIGFSRDYTLRFNIVRKFDFPRTQTISNNQPYSAYTQELCYRYDAVTNKVTSTSLQPVSVENPDSGTACVWNVPSSNPNQGITDTTIVNRRDGEGKSQYTAYDITFNKQMSGRWAFLASYVLSMRHENPTDPENPNEAFYHCSGDPGDTPTCYGPSIWDHAVKINGQYDLPLGLQWASTFSAQSGNWMSRGVQIRNGLNSNVTQIIAQQVDRYPWVNLWDNRISKKFRIGENQSIEGTFDVFNTMNVNTITSAGTTIGPASFRGLDGSLYRPSAIVAPRIFQIGARYKF